MQTLIKNCRIISPLYDENELLNILVKSGKIAAIGSDVTEDNIKSLDVGGATVIPGLIDMHCDLCEPGFEHIENLETASASAVKGGYTSITCDPNTMPAIDNKTVVQYVLAQAKTYALARVYPYGSMTVGCAGKEMAEIGEMYTGGIVALSDGDVTISDASLLRNIFKYALMFDLPVITHCEDPSFSDGVMNEGYVSTALGLKGIPREAEETIVARNIILAERVGCRLHIANVSTKGSVQLIREAKVRGVTVTCHTSPQYFSLTEEEVDGYNTYAKVRPPLRTKEDIVAIREGLVDGTIDVIASGHDPAAMENKQIEFDNATFGISAFETAFPISYTELVEKGHLNLHTLMEKMCYNPAKILGIPGGVLKEGAKADFAIVDTQEPYRVEAKNFLSKAKFSPFDGASVKGKVLYTVIGGNIIF